MVTTSYGQWHVVELAYDPIADVRDIEVFHPEGCHTEEMDIGHPTETVVVLSYRCDVGWEIEGCGFERIFPPEGGSRSGYYLVRVIHDVWTHYEYGKQYDSNIDREWIGEIPAEVLQP